MSEYVVAIFSDEGKARKGLQVLEELHEDGRVTLYGTILVRRDTSGELAIELRGDDGPARAGVGSLLGGLVGLFGAHDNAFWREHLRTEVSDDFVSDLVRELVPGRHAVIAEVACETSALIDGPMEELGATVLRQVRYDLGDEQLEQSVGASAAQLAERKAQRASAPAETIGATLEDEIEHAHERLQQMAETARMRLRDTKEQLEARLETLQDQAARATADVRSQIDRRIADLRKDLEDRQRKLAHAWQEAQQALHH